MGTLRDAARDLVAEIRKGLDDRGRHKDLVKLRRITGRGRDGTLSTISLDGECEMHGTVSPGQQGQVISATGQPFAQRGAAGIARRSSAVTVATVFLERIEPRSLPRGVTLSVTAHGRGFTAETVIGFELAGEVAHPSITVLSSALVDPDDDTRLALSIQIAADSAVGADLPVRYEDPSIGFSPRRLQRAYDVTAAASYWGFSLIDDEISATTWAEGTWLADRGTESTDGDAATLCPIVVDSAETVEPGSVAWAVWPLGIRVWDVAGDVVHTWDGPSAPPEDAIGAITPPVYFAGWLYWWTVTAAEPVEAQLWRSRCDLDSPSAIATIAVGSVAPDLDVWVAENLQIVATSSGIVARFSYVDPNPDGTWALGLFATLSGLSPAFTQDVPVPSSGDGQYGVWVPGGVGEQAVGIVENGASVGLGVIDGDIDSEPAATWPRNANWWPAGSDQTARNAGLSADGTEAVLVIGTTAVRAGAFATAGAPTAMFVFEQGEGEDGAPLHPAPSWLIPIP